MKEQPVLCTTVISLFLVVEIFSDGTRGPKICYLNIVPLQRIFRTGVRTCGLKSGVKSSSSLHSAAVTKWEFRMSLRQYFKPLLYT